MSNPKEKAPEEFIDEIDSDGNFRAKRPVGDLKKQMFLHKVVLIIPKAEGGKIILSKRAVDKHPFPNTWCCAVGGKVNHGETEEQAATREMQEEIGRSYPVVKVTNFMFESKDYKAIFSVFTTLIPISEAKFVPNPAEIQFTKSFSKEEVKRMMDENPYSFAPTFITAIKASMDLL